MSEANANMVDGYLDGLKATEDAFPERLVNRGASYRHGWLSGLADRIGSDPRGSFDEVLRLADEAMKMDAMP